MLHVPSFLLELFPLGESMQVKNAGFTCVRGSLHAATVFTLLTVLILFARSCLFVRLQSWMMPVY